ncbi:MAG: phenylalanine 4-monooxygenase [Cyclobacteriaceae bacterium]|nr:phenylalanine 4-monooxygenase [Cyclobacteriaceae bacterium]
MKSKRQIPTLQNMKQVYEKYTAQDHQVWQILFDRQIGNIPHAASISFVEGLEKVNFTRNEIPNFEKTNKVLEVLTGWKLVAVEGIVDDKLFFQLLSEKKFPATTWLRTIDELDYLEEPDMFHDVFAHVPLLANQSFVNFLEAMSAIALEHIDNTRAIELISRVYWYTIEFGLIRENNEVRIYGAGILSSAGETKFSISEEPIHKKYEVTALLETDYRKDAFQENYFIIESYEQLYNSIEMIREELKLKLLKMKVV